jgi:hypothetical protein
MTAWRSRWPAALATVFGARGPAAFTAIARQHVTVVPARLAEFVPEYFVSRGAVVRAAEEQNLQQWIASQPDGR